MAPLALALHLALASTGPASAVPPDADGAAPTLDVSVAAPAADPVAPAAGRARAPLRSMTLAPRQLDPGPFRAGEMMGATLGAFAGDALVLGAGYLALRMFADGSIAATATNFRRAVYGLGVGALVVPPTTAVLMARLRGGPYAPGGFWKAVLLASAGQLAALVAGYYAAPHFWVVLPVQAVALSVGASLGLHWGERGRAADPPEPDPDVRRAPAEPAAGTASLAAVPLCTES